MATKKPRTPGNPEPITADLARLARGADPEATKRFVADALGHEKTAVLLGAFAELLPASPPDAIAHLANALLSSWQADEAGFVLALTPHIDRCLATVERLLDGAPPAEFGDHNPVGLAARALLALVTDDSNDAALAQRIARMELRRQVEQPDRNDSLSLSTVRRLGPEAIAALLGLLARPCRVDRRTGTALDSALWNVRGGYSSFSAPLNLVAQLVVLAARGSSALPSALMAAGRELPADQRDALLLVAGFSTRWHGRDDHSDEALQKRLKEICAALGPATHPTVRKRLVHWGIVEGDVKLPREIPRTLDAALALHAELGLDPELLGKPAKKQPPLLPAPLADVYARHDRLGSRAISPPAKLPSLAKELASWVRDAEEDAEEEDDEVDRGSIHLGALSPLRDLVPFGKDAGGDFFFLDPAFRDGDELPVLRLNHAEGFRVSVEASCLAAFVAQTLLRSAYEDGPHASQVTRLAAQDAARVRVAAKLARRAKPARGR